jgi:hypothetical protein
VSFVSNMSNVTGGTSSATGGYAGPSSDDAPPSRIDKIVEIVAVLLLGITTIGTAWCGFQSVQWNSASSDHAQAASDQHIEAARQFGLATQTLSYDSMMLAQYAQAVSTGNAKLQDFYRSSLIRKDFLPTLDEWATEVKAGQEPTPLADDKEYLDSLLKGYRATVAAGEAESRKAEEAGASASAYVSVTILLAAALFFSGVVSTFRYRAARALLLAAALATLGIAASRLASLPVLLF